MTTDNSRDARLAPPLMLLINSVDAAYAQRVNVSAFGATYIRNERFVTWLELAATCKRLGVTRIATTHFPCFVQGLEGSREDNLGSLHVRDGIQILFVADLPRTLSEPHGQFMLQQWLSKLSRPEGFVQPPPFAFKELALADMPAARAYLEECFLCAVDIETARFEGGIITSCAWTGLRRGVGGKITARSYVVDMLGGHWRDGLHIMRVLNATAVPKVMQNGMYDAAYFVRFGAPLRAWLFDTYHMQHCLYPELPADLAYLTQMYCYRVRHWKEMNSYARLEYNARDTHNTAWVWLGMMLHIADNDGDYALQNFQIEFPLVFPCLHCGLDGLAVDPAVRARLHAEQTAKADGALKRIQLLLNMPAFNPNSPVHVKNLMHAMGYAADGSDKFEMRTFGERGPLELQLVKLIEDYRKARKAVGTYFEFELLEGRFLYALDPAGTETGRLASQKSPFWCGTQIQNIPGYAKSQCVPDPGWLFGAVDGSQAESRCTAYISEDARLMHSVETSPDFHCTNASLFFGVPFAELYDVAARKVLRKDIRDTAKRTNHGANYNMGAWMLVQTMGPRKVYEAGRLLKLPRGWNAVRIARHLLECFCNAYPDIKAKWYPEVVDEVRRTGRLVGATGWTRRTFLKPWNSKLDLNACVAHPPQSLSVMLVNKAFYKTWRLQMTELSGLLRLKAQVHDEIFFQHKIGAEFVAKRIGDICANTTATVHGRTLRIPNEPKFGASNWGEVKD